MKNVSTGKLVLGLILIFLGVGFLLDSIGFLNFSDVIRVYWPCILILIGLVDLANGKYRNAGFWLILGAILQLSTLEVIKFNIWTIIWPLFLVWIGLNILFKSKHEDEKVVKSSADFVSSTAIFSGDERKADSKSFKAGSVNAIFGGSKVDLRNVKIEDKAVIDVTLIFGGGELIVPKNIKVKMDAFVMFGGIDDKRSERPSGDAPILKITGTVLFGGLEIKD